MARHCAGLSGSGYRQIAAGCQGKQRQGAKKKGGFSAIASGPEYHSRPKAKASEMRSTPRLSLRGLISYLCNTEHFHESRLRYQKEKEGRLSARATGQERRLRALPVDSPAKRQNAGKLNGASTPKLARRLFPSWEIFDGRPCSLSGVKITGNKLVRSIYADETGISANDSISLVAGVIINEDTQWKSVEKFIIELIKEFSPPEHRESCVFRATDLYHCAGPIFHHKKYPRERAREALKELLSIPRRFHIPISVGYFDKKDFWKGFGPKFPHFKARDREWLSHSLAYALCAVASEVYMVNQCGPDDLARFVAENNTTTHSAVRTMHKILQGKLGDDLLDFASEMANVDRTYLPINRIVDTVLFAEKDDAPLLQIADVCAFIFRYWAEGKLGEYVDEYYDAFTGGDSLGKPPVAAFQRTWVFADEAGVAP